MRLVIRIYSSFRRGQPDTMFILALAAFVGFALGRLVENAFAFTPIFRALFGITIFTRAPVFLALIGVIVVFGVGVITHRVCVSRFKDYFNTKYDPDAYGPALQHIVDQWLEQFAFTVSIHSWRLDNQDYVNQADEEARLDDALNTFHTGLQLAAVFGFELKGIKPKHYLAGGGYRGQR